MSSHPEQQYLDIMKQIMEKGDDREDRTGVGTKAIFGTQMRFDLSKSFPLLTTKKVWFKGIVHELLWILSGDTNIKYLNDNGVHIWDEWADENGNLGNVYGQQWRRWEMPGLDNYGHYDPEYIDQIQQVINSLHYKPDSRRHIVSAWNVAELEYMKLPPCHCFFQFFVANGKLSCQMYQRSCDWFLGVPFNVASYALLTHLIAQVVGLEVGEFIHTGGDVHLYRNHFEQAREQISRTPMDFPQIEITPTVEVPHIDRYRYEDIRLIGYKSHPGIKAPIAV